MALKPFAPPLDRLIAVVLSDLPGDQFILHTIVIPAKAVDVAHQRCRQLVEGGYGQITPNEHGGFPG